MNRTVYLDKKCDKIWVKIPNKSQWLRNKILSEFSEPRILICPNCGHSMTVGNMSWKSLVCEHCLAEVDKEDWI